jgi:putative transposase
LKTFTVCWDWIACVKLRCRVSCFFEQVKIDFLPLTNSKSDEKRKVQEWKILDILKEQEQGAKVADICRKHGISDATFYNWKSKYSGITVNELKRLLEDENARLRKLVSNLSLDVDTKDLLKKSSNA